MQSNNAALILVHRLRRWPNIKLALAVFAGWFGLNLCSFISAYRTRFHSFFDK